MLNQPEADSASLVTVPNVLCGIRLVGSVGLIYLAVTSQDTFFLYAFVFLIFTDWIDGKLAILLHQRTELGARLDSVADATLYASLFFGIGWLKWEFIQQQWPWFVSVVLSYALTSLVGLFKFRRLPSYHTRMAKLSAHLVFIAVVCIFMNWAVWPFYVAASAVTVTNLEATWITMILKKWTVDVRSVFSVRAAMKRKLPVDVE